MTGEKPVAGETAMAGLGGRLAVVTGGARGIGLAICETLARDGADVVVVDMDAKGAEETADRVRRAGHAAAAFRLDVSDEAAVEAFFSDLEAAGSPFGGRAVDILVNNAGICLTTPVVDIRADEWDRVLAVNLRGTFLMSREALRRMRERGAGKIVNIASAAAKLGGLTAGAHYAASKAGVIALSKSLALAAAPYKVNVNVVCPGPTTTALTDAWGTETNRAFAEKIPWKEYGKPQDIAEAVAFLASDRARYITGEVLDVNGGLVMD
jgi:NAD(P)-dependent dehydrogenase (short-subunit alcohol dehydrogenase family)